MQEDSPNGSTTWDPAGVDSPSEFRAVADDALATLRRHWIAITLAVISVTALGVMYTLRQPKIYQAAIAIILEKTSIRPLGRAVEALEQPASYWMSQREYRVTQLGVIQSRPVLQKVVDRFNLGADLDFLRIAGLEADKQKAELLEVDPVDVLRKRVATEPVRESYLARVTVDDTDPERAARLANAMVDAYSERRRELKFQVASSAVGWLDGQVASLRSKLDEAEMELREFQRENDIGALSFEAHGELVSKRQAQLSSELLLAEKQQWEVGSRYRMVQGFKDDPAKVLSSPLAERNEVLARLRLQLQKLDLEAGVLASRYGSSHPELRESTSARDSAREELALELARVIARVELRKAEVDRIVTRVRGALSEARDKALALNSKTMAYQRLQYEIENYRTLYSVVLRRSKETHMGEMSQLADVEVMEAAVAPQIPIRPRKRVILAVSLFLGLGLGVAFAFLLDALDVRVRGVKEAEAIVGRPHIGSVEQVGERELEKKISALKGEVREKYDALDERRRIELFPTFFPKSNAAESVRLIRTNLRFLLPSKDGNTYLVASANPQEGKSTMVNYLAQSLAAAGDKTVLIIDSDLHRPMQHKAYGLENKKGVSNLIIGTNEIDEVVQETDVPNVHVITSGPSPPNSAEILGHPRFRELLVELKERYDEVILDSPPVLALSDALVLSGMVDGVVVVLRPDRTDRSALKQTIRQMNSIRAPVVGFLFNYIKPPGRGGYNRYGRYGDYYHQYYGRYARQGQYGYTQEQQAQ